jgi:hypothetical protein
MEILDYRLIPFGYSLMAVPVIAPAHYVAIILLNKRGAPQLFQTIFYARGFRKRKKRFSNC